LSEVVEDVVRDFELLIEEKGATVEHTELPVIEAISLQMNQLFYNLVGNALKFSRPGVPPVVRIASSQATLELVEEAMQGSVAPYYHITVSDNGIGFDASYAEQIFEVFKRLHTREAYPGSGIGLALCRKIVDNHGGKLWAESQPDVGTTFHLLLPKVVAAMVL
jgi:signal transduction histidine kinase